MTREQYIQKLLAIYKLKYQPSELELREFELLLQMIPDSDKFTFSLTSPDITPSNPHPWWKPFTPTTTTPLYNTSISTDQNVINQYTEANGLNKGTEEH